MDNMKKALRCIFLFPAVLLLSCRPPTADCSKDDLTCNPVMSLLRRNACSLSHFEVIQPGNWPIVQAEINYQISLGQSSGPAITSFGPPAPGGGAYDAGVLAPNGKIYLPPRNNTSYRLIDTSNDTVSTFGEAAPGGNAYYGGVLAPNGKVYFVSYIATSYQYIQTKANGSFCPAIALSGYFNKY